MSPENPDKCLKGYEELVKILSPNNDNSREITPHALMERMKKSAGEGLSILGKYIKDNLKVPSDLSYIQWVVFHFDVPTEIFRESATRNWIAINSKDQDDVDQVHSVAINEERDLSQIYAPSILAANLSKVRPDKADYLRNMMWLYKTQSFDKDFCCKHSMEGMDFLCFSEGNQSDGTSVVFLSACTNESLEVLNGITTLGELLQEPEEESLIKFRNFGQYVLKVPNNEGPLKSTLYARIPVFFYGTDKKYMSVIFVAFKAPDNEAGKIISLLGETLPALKAAIILINSQVAYAVGDISRRYEMASLLHAVLRHDMQNLGAGVDERINQVLHYWDRWSQDENKIRGILEEIRANTTLAMMSTELDYLWNTSEKNRLKSIPISMLQPLLNKTWHYARISKCEFTGDWNSQLFIPEICKVVFSNLIRNAVEEPENTILRIDCKVNNNDVSFGCLSQKSFSEEDKKYAFQASLATRIPSEKRGLWICRYIIENLLKGRLYLAEETREFRTHIRFDLPSH